MNKIILTHDIFEEAQSLKDEFDSEFSRFYIKEEFKIDDANEVIAEAYLSSYREKTLVLAANLYNLFAQNALLKILEESPKNIAFILIGKNKNSFLPTVRSRLILEDKREKEEKTPFAINLLELDLQKIYTFLNQDHESGFEYAKQQIQALLDGVFASGIKLTQEDLKSFDEAILASLNYQRFQYVILPLLLMILERKNKK
ncbi:DNA polymerase III subunit delta' [Helicobacter sp. faydin-H20]|uniref:DNA polymerase III subunit delta' n=1 Tax=Helicobacter anatolicus TaxID=2905874 RepID=UPI001E4251BC|nr:DNA polymerase III subunit delta' [Helicobacter anatolicus]MCE3037032.1 DNA polymerase III subunit delta' [Helicobacter anatolicus]